MVIGFLRIYQTGFFCTLTTFSLLKCISSNKLQAWWKIGQFSFPMINEGKNECPKDWSLFLVWKLLLSKERNSSYFATFFREINDTLHGQGHNNLLNMDYLKMFEIFFLKLPWVRLWNNLDIFFKWEATMRGEHGYHQF